MALAAEIDETSNTFEIVRWSLGGIIFFARSVVSDALAWLKLPAGGSLFDGGPVDPSLFPKRSRFFAIAILTATAVVLFLPEGREAISTVRASWREFGPSRSDRRALETLAARAEKENDAATLAFVALATDGLEALSGERFTALADRAVLLDPRFVWVYGTRITHWPRYGPPPEGTFERMQAADPGNSVPELLAADALAEPRFYEALHANTKLETLLASDPKWMALMERAFAEPRYDSYFQRQLQLTRTVWNRDRYLSPSIILSMLQFTAIPNLSLDVFSEIKIHEAEEARATGDLQRAESLLRDVGAFAERIVNGTATNREKAHGLWLGREANRKLAAFYTGAGRTADARTVDVRVQQIEERLVELRPPSSDSCYHENYIRAHPFGRGMLVQGFGSLAVIAGFTALAGILLLELWPARLGYRKTLWRRALCWTADYAPSALLVASSALLLSFLPYARLFAEFRSANYALPDVEHLAEVLRDLSVIRNYVLNVAVERVSIWTFVTVALAALAVFIVARSFYRARRVRENHS